MSLNPNPLTTKYFYLKMENEIIYTYIRTYTYSYMINSREKC